MTSTVDVTVHSDLLALLTKNAAVCEREGVIVPDNIEALSAAGMFRLLGPRAHGGFEVSPRQFVEICTELGRGCGSSAWVASIMNSCTWALNRFPDAVRESVFAGPAAPMVCGVVAPTGECVGRRGHLEITGSWAYASGCLHAEWALLGVLNVNESGDTLGRSIALVPMKELTIERTWDAVGLSGTGSHTLRADHVEVPQPCVIGMDVAASGRSGSPGIGPLFRNALVPILALALAGPLLGMALGALDCFDRKDPQSRVDNAGTSADARLPVIGVIDMARDSALTAASTTQAWALSSTMMPAVDQVKVKLDIAEVARDTRAAVDSLLDIAGVRGLSRDSELARYWRDIAVGSRHGMLNFRRVSEEYGRLLLG
jgi:3-hydroxy-9,10-secoandrosta-1,3,5(10)-triene-9,17-dione monooxygenase